MIAEPACMNNFKHSPVPNEPQLGSFGRRMSIAEAETLPKRRWSWRFNSGCRAAWTARVTTKPTGEHWPRWSCGKRSVA